MIRTFSNGLDELYHRVKFGEDRTTPKVQLSERSWSSLYPGCSCENVVFRSYIGRWRHKIRKFAVEIFQNVKKIGRRVVPYTSYSY